MISSIFYGLADGINGLFALIFINNARREHKFHKPISWLCIEIVAGSRRGCSSGVFERDVGDMSHCAILQFAKSFGTKVVHSFVRWFRLERARRETVILDPPTPSCAAIWVIRAGLAGRRPAPARRQHRPALNSSKVTRTQLARMIQARIGGVPPGARGATFRWHEALDTRKRVKAYLLWVRRVEAVLSTPEENMGSVVNPRGKHG
jgi:hypothetical protein